MIVRTLLVLFAALALAPFARAAQGTTTVSASDFTVEARLIAASIQQGYGVVALRVRAAPELTSERRVDVRFLGGRSASTVAEWRGSIRPGAVVEDRVLVPTGQLMPGSIQMHVFGATTISTLPHAAQSTMSGAQTVPLFHVAPVPFEASRLMAFAESLSAKQMPKRPEWPTPASAHWTPPGVPPGFRFPMPPAGAIRNSSHYSVAPLLESDVPRRWVELTSATGIVVEDPAALGPALLATLLDHARAGGVLVLCGGTPDDLVRRVPELAPLLEARFALRDFPEDEPGTARVHALGLGKLVTSERGVAAPGEDQSAGLRQALWWCLETERGWLRHAHSLEAPLMEWANRSRADLLPRHVLVAMCIAMAVAIGPLSYLVALRKKRPVLLLVFVPAISLGMAFLLVVVVVVLTGFHISADGASLAVLDQRTGDLAVGEARGTTAGFTLVRGLRPAAGVAVLAASTAEQPWKHRGPERRIEEDGALLTGAFLPPRERALSTVLSVRRTRQRLDVTAASGTYEVVNGFDSTIEDLVLRDPRGRWFTGSAIAPGATARLSETPEMDALAHIAAANVAPPEGLRLLDLVAPATYVARLGEGTLVADVGVSLRWDERDAPHGVVGILPEEGW